MLHIKADSLSFQEMVADSASQKAPLCSDEWNQARCERRTTVGMQRLLSGLRSSDSLFVARKEVQPSGCPPRRFRWLSALP